MSTIKQYKPMKPMKGDINYGAWQKGLVNKFKFYQGQDEEMEDGFKDWELGEKVVYH